jgi:hypothetical protein
MLRRGGFSALVVLAEPIAIAISHDDDEVYTWRKYRLLEKLSAQPIVPEELLPEAIPSSLLPLQPDEFVMAIVGGTVIIDGVKIIQAPEIQMPEGKAAAGTGDNPLWADLLSIQTLERQAAARDRPGRA